MFERTISYQRVRNLAWLIIVVVHSTLVMLEQSAHLVQSNMAFDVSADDKNVPVFFESLHVHACDCVCFQFMFVKNFYLIFIGVEHANEAVRTTYGDEFFQGSDAERHSLCHFDITVESVCNFWEVAHVGECLRLLFRLLGVD